MKVENEKVIERQAIMPTTVNNTSNMPTVYGFPGEVQMAKELVKAAHGLNIHELRLVRYAASTIHPTAQQPPQLFIKIPAIAYADAMEVRESKHFYKDLEKAADGLWNKQIRIRRDTSKGPVIEKIGWISHSKYHRGEGWIELRFTAEVTPLLSMLKDGSKIIYKLQNLIDLKSVYAARLYELLMQWQDTKRLLIRLDDFRHTLEVPEKYLFGDIKVNCLDKPIKELKEKGKLDVEYTVIKDKDNKRKVGSLEFRWKPVEQIEMPLNGGKTPKKPRGSRTQSESEERNLPKPTAPKPEPAATKERASKIKIDRIPSKREVTATQDEAKKVLEDYLSMTAKAAEAGKQIAELATPQQMETYRKYKLPVD